MRKLLIAFYSILFLCGTAHADISNQLNFEEADGSPSTYPYKVIVSNGTLTDNGDGTSSLTTGGGGSGITIGTTTITSGTDTRVLFDDGGVVGENAGFTYSKTLQKLTASGLVVTPAVQTSYLYPTADSTTAIQIRKADATSAMVNFDTTNARVGIGTTSPQGSLHISSGGFFPLIVERTSSAFGQGFQFRSSGSGSPGVQAGDQLVRFMAVGMLNTGSYPAASSVQDAFTAYATEAFTATAQGRDLRFFVVPNGTTATTQALTILNSGNIGIGTTTPQDLFQVDTSMLWSASPNTLSISRDVGQFGNAINISSETGALLASVSHDGSASFQTLQLRAAPLSAVEGGTGLRAGTSGGVPYFSSNTTIASSLAFAANAVVIGGGAGTAPLTITADATARHALMSTTGAPAFSQINTGDVVGTLPVARGGTGITSGTLNGVAYFANAGLMASTTGDATTTHALFAGTPAFRAITTNDIVGTFPSAGATPGGATTQLQYNSASTFAGTPGITTDGIRLAMGPNTSTVVSLDVAGNFRTVPFQLTDGANIALDVTRSNFYYVVLGGNRTLSNPTNGIPGLGFTLMVSQDGTGSRKLGFGTAYKFGTDVPSYDSSTTAGTKDYIKMRFSTANSCDICGISKGYR